MFVTIFTTNDFNKNETTVALDEGASVFDALNVFPGLPNDIGLFVLNGIAVSQQEKLKSGDKLELFPLIISG